MDRLILYNTLRNSRKRRQERHKRKLKRRDLLPLMVANIFEHNVTPVPVEILSHLQQISLRMRRMSSVPKANENFWERVLLAWDDEAYRENLRLHRETFNFLCHELSAEVSKQNTNYKEAISPDCRIAICLWRLASGTTYREIGKIFGLGRSTVFKITIEVCTIVSHKLLNKYVKMPDSARTASLDFSIRNQMPNCVGAIDGCHIPIPKPSVDGEDYYNRKGWYSINMQAVVDQKGRFIDVVIGWPGKAHDSRVLRNSEIFKRGQDGTLFPQSDLSVGGHQIPFYIIGDSAYPLLPWLMKPFPQMNGRAETYFNKKLSKARNTVERAFGRLKARWRCLLKRCDASPNNAKVMIAACITLHNLCEMRGDTLSDLEDHLGTDDADENNDELSPTGLSIRNALRDFLCNADA